MKYVIDSFRASRDSFADANNCLFGSSLASEAENVFRTRGSAKDERGSDG